MDGEEELSGETYQGLVKVPATASLGYAIVIDGSAVVFSLVSVNDYVALGNLSPQSSYAHLRYFFIPPTLNLMPDRFSPTI